MPNRDIRDLFNLLNKNCIYVVLRNWDDVFDESIYGTTHEDIDILCDDLEKFIKITGAYRVHKNKYRDNFIVPCGNLSIRFDVRWLGDGYYPKEMEEAILHKRLLNESDMYTPCPEDYFFSLAYHALLQKNKLSEEYLLKLNNIYSKITNDITVHEEGAFLKMLKDYLEEHKFRVTTPSDPAVYLNWANIHKLPYNNSFYREIRRYLYRFERRLLKRS